jgi:hypothetical protein
MAAFFDKIEEPQEGVEYKRDPATGLLVQLRDNRFANAQGFTSDISYNKLDEKTFDSFRYKWPSAEIVDERDEIHRQGWTLVQISGTLGHRAVQGHCRIPFTYNKSREFPPLMKMNIGAEQVLIDCPAGAYVLNNDNRMIASYPAGTFFKGFMRPWYGMHTVDIIRRDAARHRIAFTVENQDYDKEMDDFRRKQITLHDAPDHPDVNIVIRVDLEMNQIETMEFMSATAPLGKLEFSYPQDPAAIKEEIALPIIKKSWLVRERPLQTLWLIKLVEESWDEP